MLLKERSTTSKIIPKFPRPIKFILIGDSLKLIYYFKITLYIPSLLGTT